MVFFFVDSAYYMEKWNFANFNSACLRTCYANFENT